MIRLREAIKSEEEKMTFNEKLIRLRKINSLTQDEFAKSVGVSRQAVYKWESGQSFPEVPTLLQIKALFSVSIDDLLDESFEIALPEKKTRRVRAKSASVSKPAEENADPDATEKEDAIENTVQATSVKEENAISKEDIITEAVDESKDSGDENASEEKAEVNAKKKVGFFGRLFGRK
jgi:DNA-binding XRE family transcriptional regulator